MEQRLIDANALKRKIKTECNPYGNPTIDFESGKKVLKIIDNAPTVDTTFREVVAYECGKNDKPKGEWRSVGFEKGYAFCICSNCGKTTKLVRDSRNEFCCLADIREKAVACLYCGADMRGDI